MYNLLLGHAGAAAGACLRVGVDGGRAAAGPRPAMPNQPGNRPRGMAACGWYSCCEVHIFLCAHTQDTLQM